MTDDLLGDLAKKEADKIGALAGVDQVEVRVYGDKTSLSQRTGTYVSKKSKLSILTTRLEYVVGAIDASTRTLCENPAIDSLGIIADVNTSFEGKPGSLELNEHLVDCKLIRAKADPSA